MRQKMDAVTNLVEVESPDESGVKILFYLNRQRWEMEFWIRWSCWWMRRRFNRVSTEDLIWNSNDSLVTPCRVSAYCLEFHVCERSQRRDKRIGANVRTPWRDAKKKQNDKKSENHWVRSFIDMTTAAGLQTRAVVRCSAFYIPSSWIHSRIRWMRRTRLPSDVRKTVRLVMLT